jgi:hypothetical protein
LFVIDGNGRDVSPDSEAVASLRASRLYKIRGVPEKEDKKIELI